MSLNIQILMKPNRQHHFDWCSAFALGVGADILETQDKFDLIRDNTDLVVFWSMRWDAVIQDCKRMGIPFFCLEMGYIDRENFASVNLNGLNGRSQLQVPNNNARCMKHGWYQKDTKVPGNKIVIMGQMPGDRSLEGININDWALKVHERYKSIGLHTEFKPHPLYRGEIPKIPIFTGDIHKDASYIVTYSSNSGVDAWLNGVAAIAHSEMSMLWKWQHKVGFGNEFINDLSYRQYSLEEFRSGEAWHNLQDQILKSK